MDYKVGDLIEYRTFTGGTRVVRVTNKESDIKNGRPGFDGTEIDTGCAVWGYDYQITRNHSWSDRGKPWHQSYT